MRTSIITKSGAVIQIVMLLLLQFSAVAPGLARSLQHRETVSHCTGDHEKCGCAPERVASRSCCCFLNHRAGADQNDKTSKSEKLSCCNKLVSQSIEVASEHNDDRSVPAISSIPCGSDPRFAASAAENIKFLHPGLLRDTPVLSLNQPYLTHHDSYSSRVLEPPEHPPKLISAVIRHIIV
jgi:hypothetical protein